MEDGRVCSSSSLKVQELKYRLTRLGLPTTGNKAILQERLNNHSMRNESETIMRNHINEDETEQTYGQDTQIDLDVNSRANPHSDVNQVDLVETPGSLISTRVKCPCYEYFYFLIKNLTRDITSMKERINYTQENSSLVIRLKEENAELRAQLSSLKEKYDTILDERDSLNLAVKIISKELHSSWNVNLTPLKTPSLVLENRKSQRHVNLTASEEKTATNITPEACVTTTDKVFSLQNTGRAWLAQLVRSLPSNHKVPGSILGYAKN